jgi:hypothetical protein
MATVETVDQVVAAADNLVALARADRVLRDKVTPAVITLQIPVIGAEVVAHPQQVPTPAEPVVT